MSFGAESSQEGHNRANVMTAFRGKAHTPTSFTNRWQNLHADTTKSTWDTRRGWKEWGHVAAHEQSSMRNATRHDHRSSVWWGLTCGPLPGTAVSSHRVVCLLARHDVVLPVTAWGGPWLPAWHGGGLKDLNPIGKSWSKSCVPLSAVTAELTTRYCTELWRGMIPRFSIIQQALCHAGAIYEDLLKPALACSSCKSPEMISEYHHRA